MSTKKTTNLGLHSWERTDAFIMDEFNENFDKIDEAVGGNKAALATKATQTEIARLDGEIARLDAAMLKFDCGTYKGDGTKNRMINLPFTPKMVFVADNSGAIFIFGPYSYFYGGLALAGNPAGYDGTIVEVVEGGFRVSHTGESNTSNLNGKTFRYFALG